MIVKKKYKAMFALAGPMIYPAYIRLINIDSLQYNIPGPVS